MGIKLPKLAHSKPIPNGSRTSSQSLLSLVVSWFKTCKHNKHVESPERDEPQTAPIFDFGQKASEPLFYGFPGSGENLIMTLPQNTDHNYSGGCDF